MEEGRLFPTVFRKKPRIILDKRFPFVDEFELGDKGQLELVVEIESKSLEPDEMENEFVVVHGVIKQAKPFNVINTRV